MWALQQVSRTVLVPSRWQHHGRRVSTLELNYVVPGSGSSIQGIILGPRDRLFDAGKVIAKQFLGLRAGDVHISAIDERHGNFCGREGAGSTGGISGNGHKPSSCRLSI